MWKGGQTKRNGYVYIICHGHPFAQRWGKVKRARLVMEEHLRKTDPSSPYLVKMNGEVYLSRQFDVHHKNEIKDDDRIENLEVLTPSEHARLHGKERKHILRKKTIGLD